MARRRASDIKQGASWTHDYADDQSVSAKRDMVDWAINQAQRRGACPGPFPAEINGLLADPFWKFILMFRTRSCFARSTDRAAAQVKDLRQLQKRANALLETLVALEPLLVSNEEFLSALLANLAARREGKAPRKVMSESVDLVRRSIGFLQRAVDRAVSDRLHSRHDPRSERGRLVQDAFELDATSGKWWSGEPSNEDLAALTILAEVAFAEFEDDFQKRDQYAIRAAGGRGRPTSHLKGLLHNEMKRCAALSPRNSVQRESAR